MFREKQKKTFYLSNLFNNKKVSEKSTPQTKKKTTENR